MADIATVNRDRTEVANPQPTRGGSRFTPRVDIYETEKELLLQAELPGVKPQDVELRYEKGELSLFGRVQRRHPNKALLLQEYEEGDFFRSFSIHESIDANRIQAEHKNGLLTVHLPKVEAVQPRKIAIKS
jgi:HSP20 family protein